MPNITLYSDRNVLALGLREVLAGRHSVEIAGLGSLVPPLLAFAVKNGSPRAAILDASPGTAELVGSLRAADMRLPLIIWEHTEAIEPALNALALGVQAVLVDTSAPQDVLACIDTVLNGGTWLPQTIAQAALMSRQCKLSRREGQLTTMISTGLSNKEIAWQLGISVGTVKVYLCRLFEKLGVSDRYELALLALRQTGWENQTTPSRPHTDPPRSVFIPRKANDWREMTAR